MWSADATVRGRTVLAFLDNICIGSGKIDGFRQDLKDAGLGDGYAGFNFNLTYPNPADAPRVVVKIDGSDAVLVQHRARLASGSASRTGGQISMSSLEWMRGRGWLSQSDFDFMRFSRQFGVYERSLVIPKEAGAAGDRGLPQMLDAAETAESMLGLTRFDEAVCKRETVAKVADWRRLCDQQEALGSPGAMLCLWSSGRARLPVLEGSHLNPPAADDKTPRPLGTDYSVGPDRLLFLDSRCLLGAAAAFPAGGIDVFYLEG
jgi:hypothetical protein